MAPSPRPSPAATAAHAGSRRLGLAGTWRLRLDRENRGVEERWFLGETGDPIELPGSLASQGRGDPITVDTPWTGSIFDPSYYRDERYAPYRKPGNIKVPFWLQPETHYAGVAWYQRTIHIPNDWTHRRVVLTLERPHWRTQAWLDGEELGSRDSLSTPHVYELGAGLRPGEHVLTLRIDNTRLLVDIGENSHSISDHTQGNWNGVIGDLALESTDTLWIDELQVYPLFATKGVQVAGRLQRLGSVAFPEFVAVGVAPTDGRAAGNLRCVANLPVASDGGFAGELSLRENAAEWDEFSPALHEVTARLLNGEERRATFGLREVRAEGRQLTINGRKLFVRGTLECAIFPKTGHPPVDVDSWKRLLGVVREHGLNTVRFHSWCPPRAAFQAGDELGVYFQIEAASWPNQSTTLGAAQPVDLWLEQETIRILREYGNHPCFLFMASSNEPGGEATANAYLSAWLKRRRAEDPRRLFTSGAGWPILPENQYHVHSDPRIQHWTEGLASRINARPPETRTDYRAFVSQHEAPVVSHEIGQWCAFPDFSEMSQYTGYLKPRNFEIFRATLDARGLQSKAAAFLQASGKLQTLCYKEDIESALRTESMGGFHLLDLHDFPGQGTALVGVLNAFWGSKGYVTPEAFRRFCNSTVPLVRLTRRVFTTADRLEADCEVAHYGAHPLRKAVVQWRLIGDDGAVLARVQFDPCDLNPGVNVVGAVRLDLREVQTPARCKLVLGIEGTSYENDWDIWIYPERLPAVVPKDVLVSREIGVELEDALRAGETVILSLRPERVANPGPDPVRLGFSSIFWNTSWTNRQPPTTLGILCDPAHPALRHFPTDAHSNWQWWYVVTRAAALRLDQCPVELEPIVSVIDDWFTSRRLGLVVEARVGAGRLLVTSIDFSDQENPVTRQLWNSLLSYAGQPPAGVLASLTLSQVRAFAEF